MFFWFFHDRYNYEINALRESENLRFENEKLEKRVARLETTIGLLRDALSPPGATKRPSPESQFIMTHVRNGKIQEEE